MCRRCLFCYELLSTALVMPKDTEELALTLCGKKRKLTRQHLEEAMIQSGLDAKVCDTIFSRFIKVTDQWEEFIRKSFLTEYMADSFIQLIKECKYRMK